MYKFKRFLIRIKSYYAFDARALGLMRIALALVIIADLCIRFTDLTAFYTDEGILPSHLLGNFGWQPGYWSIYTFFNSTTYVYFVCSIHFLLAISFLIGYRVKLTTLLLWAFTVSLHNRNLFVLQSGDDLLRLVLFWSIFLPIGHTFSWDSKKYTTQKSFANFNTIGYILLICSVYVFTVFFKNSNEWRSDGTAIYFALSLDQIKLPLGDWLYNYPGLMKALTHVVYVIEILIPLCILIPTKKNWGKFMAFTFILILHMGIGLTVYVGLFYIINMTTAIVLIPSSVLDKFKILAISNTHKIKRKSYAVINYTSSLFAILIITLCLLINLSYMHWFNYELDSGLSRVVNTLRLNQYWGMFSPHIMKEDGWYVYVGYKENGDTWDLKNNQKKIDATKPLHLVKDYKNDRWRKLAENIQRNEYTFLRPLYCKYYLKRWNTNNPGNQMKSLEFVFYKEISDANYTAKPLERSQFCFCITND